VISVALNVISSSRIESRNVISKTAISAIRTVDKINSLQLDADFHALLAVTSHVKPSVVRIRQEGLNGDALAALVSRIWPSLETAIAQGAVVTVTQHRIRLRLLPIG